MRWDHVLDTGGFIHDVNVTVSGIWGSSSGHQVCHMGCQVCLDPETQWRVGVGGPSWVLTAPSWPDHAHSPPLGPLASAGGDLVSDDCSPPNTALTFLLLLFPVTFMSVALISYVRGTGWSRCHIVRRSLRIPCRSGTDGGARRQLP